jgi:dissimilatory sulfite reductase (desulfoviridin) alpha/beta subunit
MTRTLKELLSSEDKVVVKHADSRAKTIIELIGAEEKACPHKNIVDGGGRSTIKYSKCIDCGKTIYYEDD